MVYKDCNIGSAKPSKKILKKFPHKLVDHISPNKIYDDFYDELHLNPKGSLKVFSYLSKKLEKIIN